MAMELGRQFGVHGRVELVYLMWLFVKLDTFKFGEMQGLRYEIIAPEGGFHNSNKMGINNPTESKQYPMVVEDPNNPD